MKNKKIFNILAILTIFSIIVIYTACKEEPKEYPFSITIKNELSEPVYVRSHCYYEYYGSFLVFFPFEGELDKGEEITTSGSCKSVDRYSLSLVVEWSKKNDGHFWPVNSYKTVVYDGGSFYINITTYKDY